MAECSIETCDRPVAKRGWCNRHYQRWWKYGDPAFTHHRADRGEPLAKLQEWVATRDRSTCWIWPYRKRKGYGVLTVARVTVKAHRLAYAIDHGVPLRHDGCHTCDTPACFNPDHIFDGTHAQNVADAKRKGRLALPPRSRPGRRVAHKRLSAEAVRSIRADERTNAAVAADYGVSPTLISNVRNGKAWGWVE